MWNILNTKLYVILSDPLYKSDSDVELKKSYKEFVEKLIMYLDTENDNIKRIRTLNTTQVEFEMIRSLELSYGAKKDILKIVYSEKVLLFTSKELELTYRQMQYPKYFINIESEWKSPLHINHDEIKLIDIMELACGLFYIIGGIFRYDRKELFLTDVARIFEKMFNISFGDIHKKEEAVIKRKPQKITEFLDRLKAVVIQKSKDEGYN